MSTPIETWPGPPRAKREGGRGRRGAILGGRSGWPLGPSLGAGEGRGVGTFRAGAGAPERAQVRSEKSAPGGPRRLPQRAEGQNVGLHPRLDSAGRASSLQSAAWCTTLPAPVPGQLLCSLFRCSSKTIPVLQTTYSSLGLLNGRSFAFH